MKVSELITELKEIDSNYTVLLQSPDRVNEERFVFWVNVTEKTLTLLPFPEELKERSE